MDNSKLWIESEKGGICFPFLAPGISLLLEIVYDLGQVDRLAR
jgi:hypothetical protein